MKYNFDEFDDFHLTREGAIIVLQIWTGLTMLFVTYNYFLQ